MIIADLRVGLLSRNPEEKAETIMIDNIFEQIEAYEVDAKLITEVENDTFCKFIITMFIEDVREGPDEIYNKLINPHSRVRNLLNTVCCILYNNQF